MQWSSLPTPDDGREWLCVQDVCKLDGWFLGTSFGQLSDLSDRVTGGQSLISTQFETLKFKV